MKEKDKRKLSIEEQIADLKEKNIKFDIYSEEEAKKFHEDEDKIPVWSFIDTLSIGRFI